MKEVKVAFVAPGQGFTSWEDGLPLLEQSPSTEKIYSQVFKATGVDIVQVCESASHIEDTAIVQPAALGIGVARAQVLREKDINPDYLIGLSAGEFTVAAISGALSLPDAARIAQQRGAFQMEAAGGKGGAITALHRRPLNIKSLLHGLEGTYASNFHAPNVTGFSYLHSNYDQLVEKLKEQGARVRDVKNLKFPPHTPHVMDAQKKLAELLKKKGVVRDATVPIIAIRNARPSSKARSIRKNLIWQTTQPTRLNDAVNQAIRAGVEEFYDLGPGDSISKLLGNIVTNDAIRIVPVSK